MFFLKKKILIYFYARIYHIYNVHFLFNTFGVALAFFSIISKRRINRNRKTFSLQIALIYIYTPTHYVHASFSSLSSIMSFFKILFRQKSTNRRGWLKFIMTTFNQLNFHNLNITCRILNISNEWIRI